MRSKPTAGSMAVKMDAEHNQSSQGSMVDSDWLRDLTAQVLRALAAHSGSALSCRACQARNESKSVIYNRRRKTVMFRHLLQHNKCKCNCSDGLKLNTEEPFTLTLFCCPRQDYLLGRNIKPRLLLIFFLHIWRREITHKEIQLQIFTRISIS